MRFFAAVALVAWLGALWLCSSECAAEEPHSNPGHHEQAASSQHASGEPADSDGHEGHSDFFCDSVKSVFHARTGDLVPKPDFGPALILSIPAPVAPVPAESETPVSRQAKPWFWVFTPEVCLGPALRSHAPPLA